MEKTHKHSSGLGYCGQLMVSLLLVGGTVYWLFPEFRSQLFSALPFLFLLLCPLMHLFMHRGHGKHQHGGHDKST